jgi:cytochrome c553
MRFGRRIGLPSWPRLRLMVLTASGLGALLVVGGLLFAWSGIYNVGASAGHWPITRALLALGLDSSVRTHSIGIEAPPLDDLDTIRLGAGHFAGGCAPCHGAPGVPINPIWRNMLPPPPDLAHAVADWETEELFWIVKNGIKYTAMPAWPAQRREDEVWSVVAFLRQLPQLDANEYGELASLAAARGTEAEPTGSATAPELLTVCGRCHGEEGSPTSSRLVPGLYGQSRAYMADALRSYAKGSRFSGIMQPVAAELTAAEIEELSSYYARLSAAESAPAAAGERDAIARGERLATEGLPAEGIPPCLACHGENRAEIFPRLAGQHAPYIVSQLRLFRSGDRGVTPKTRIMEAIASRLSVRHIADAAAYFESLGQARSEADAPQMGASAGADGAGR